MFNLQGSEIIFILLLALVVLGPEKLPGAIRRFTKTYAELRKMGTSFQDEVKSAFDEPMREVRETADLIKQQVDVDAIEADHAVSAASLENGREATSDADDDEVAGTIAETSDPVVVGPPDADDVFADEPTSDADDARPAPGTDPLAPPVAGTARPGPGSRPGASMVPPPPPPFAGSNGVRPPTTPDLPLTDGREETSS